MPRFLLLFSLFLFSVSLVFAMHHAAEKQELAVADSKLPAFSKNFLGQVVAQDGKYFKVRILKEKQSIQNRPDEAIEGVGGSITFNKLTDDRYDELKMVGDTVIISAKKVPGAKVGSYLDIESIGVKEMSTGDIVMGVTPAVKEIVGTPVVVN